MSAEQEQRRIVKAAVRTPDGKIHVGMRHGQIMQAIWQAALEADQELPHIYQEDQGFVDQYGTFWNRFQAGAIAFRAGQTTTRRQELNSEHLW